MFWANGEFLDDTGSPCMGFFAGGEIPFYGVVITEAGNRGRGQRGRMDHGDPWTTMDTIELTRKDQDRGKIEFRNHNKPPL
jgi:hypothetical protein